MPPETLDRGRDDRERQAPELVGVPHEVTEHAAQLDRHQLLEREPNDTSCLGRLIVHGRWESLPGSR
jgi:hypothetical protein